MTYCFIEAGFTRDLHPEPEPSSPQAEAVELTAKFLRFTAALMSRPYFAPHPQAHPRTESGIFSAMLPHSKQVFNEGNQRSAATIRPPRIATLYSSCRRNSKKPMSAMERARRRFCTMPRTFKSSMPMVWNRPVRSAVSWRKALIRNWQYGCQFGLGLLAVAAKLSLSAAR